MLIGKPISGLAVVGGDRFGEVDMVLTVKEQVGVDADEQVTADVVGMADQSVQRQPVGDVARSDDDRRPGGQIRITADIEISRLRTGIGGGGDRSELGVIGPDGAQPRTVGSYGAGGSGGAGTGLRGGPTGTAGSNGTDGPGGTDATAVTADRTESAPTAVPAAKVALVGRAAPAPDDNHPR